MASDTRKYLRVTCIALAVLFAGPASAYDMRRDGGRGMESSEPGRYPVDPHAEVRPGVVLYKRAEREGAAGESAALDRTLQRLGVSEQPLFGDARDDAAGFDRIRRLRLPPGTDPRAAAAELMREADVVWAEPAYRRFPAVESDDPLRGFQWHMDRMEVYAAWDLAGPGDSGGVIIGIVDSGVDRLHEDLADNIWVNPRETADDGVDNDGNGYVDDVNGWDFGAGDDDPGPEPASNLSVADKDRWHGTAVAGAASAVTNNGYGIAAPAFNAKILPVKVLSEDGIFWSDVLAAGIVYAADNGADVINVSLGGVASHTEAEAVAHASSAGALVVASAGNDNMNRPNYPAAYREVMSVAATDAGDGKASFSNWHRSVDVSAPGAGVYTIWGNGFQGVNGTSFSAPLMSGVAALVKRLHPDWTGKQMGEQVRVSSDPIDALNPGNTGGLGRGRVNARRALGLVSPSIRLVSYAFSEGEDSNGDGLFQAGEEIHFVFRLKNYLAEATNVRLSLSSSHSDVTVPADPIYPGWMDTMGEFENAADPVGFRIAAGAVMDREIEIRFTITADGGYEDADGLSFTPLPSYGNVIGGNVLMTVSAFGRLGSADIDRGLGDGFVFGGTENLLFEGAVMAAVSPDSVSDVARRSGPGQNTDFRTATDGDLVISKPGAQGDEELRSRFTDAGIPGSLGLGVDQRVLAFSDAPDDNYLLLAYSLYKVDDSRLNDLYFGLFMDWDVGNNGASSSTNRPLFDPASDLGIVYDPVSSLFGGLAVVSEGGAGAYKSIKNDVELFDADEYSDAEKWAHLSGGIRPVDTSSPSDYSHVLGVGPLDLAPGDTVLVGFAVSGGTSLEDMRAGVQAARAKWNALLDDTNKPGQEGEIPSGYRLGDNFPNPFNPETRIAYRVAAAGRVSLVVYDAMGREVARLVEGERDAGEHRAVWGGRDGTAPAPSGVYFYEMRAGDYRSMKKMVLIR